jgi:16S rRNA processing protein RimM
VQLFAVPPARAVGPVPVELTLRSVRDHNGVLLLGFEGFEDRNAADTLRGVMLEAEVDPDEQEPDAWYDHQLVGLAAVDPAGRSLGEVVAVEHPGAQDRLVIRRPDGVNRMVPFVTAIVPTVDVPGGRVVIDAPAGLIEDAED